MALGAVVHDWNPSTKRVPEKKGRGWRTKRKISHMGYLLIPPITDNKCKKEKKHILNKTTKRKGREGKEEGDSSYTRQHRRNDRF